MPPKRKQPDTTQAAPAPSTRSTRASTRAQKKEEDVPQPTKKKAPSKKAPKSAAKEVDDKADAVIATEEPPAKRAKITKSTTPAAKAKRGKAINALDDASVLKDKPESSTAVETPLSIELKKAPKVTLAKIMYSEAAAVELFTTYADPDEPQVIGPEGLEKFCTEADIPMEGALPILLSWQLNAQEMGRLEKASWTKWTTERKLSSLPIIKLSLEELNDLLIDNKAPVQKPSKKTDEPYDRSTYWQCTADPKDAFHKLYFYSFGLVKTPQSRNIDMETAKAFWTVLLAPKYTLMSEVLQFINDREGAYKAVNKDLWSMMLEFCETMNPNLDGYEADGAWPTLLDEFVAHKKGAE